MLDRSPRSEDNMHSSDTFQNLTEWRGNYEKDGVDLV